jgi:hypothetical protein
MQKHIAASAGAAALVAALSSVAVATPMTPDASPVVAGKHDRQAAVGLPVHVAACDFSSPIAALNIGTGAIQMSESPYQLHIRFSNGGDQPITRLVVALNDGSTVVDAGTFAPGVMIDHTFDIAPGEADSCSIASATFADGTEWKAH